MGLQSILLLFASVHMYANFNWNQFQINFKVSCEWGNIMHLHAFAIANMTISPVNITIISPTSLINNINSVILIVQGLYRRLDLQPSVGFAL